MKNLRNHKSFEKESEREFVNISNLGINESVLGSSNVVENRIPTGKAGYRTSNFCYIQVIVFDLGYLPLAAVGTIKNVKTLFIFFTFFHSSGLAQFQPQPLLDSLGQKL